MFHSQLPVFTPFWRQNIPAGYNVIMSTRETTQTAMARVVVGYVRVSTEEQAAEGVSLDAQEAALRAYSAMRGLTLVEVVIDAGVSAGKPLSSREGGRRVLDLVKRGKVGAVIAWKLDRLFRDRARWWHVH